jgi:hypothetical protein
MQLKLESPETQPDVLAVTQESEMTAKKAKATKRTAVAKKATNGNGAAKAAKGPGVIATIVDCISKEKGATSEECLAVLVKAFPDRDPDGMIKTIRIQAAKNASSKERDEKRGLVYYKRRKAARKI